MLNQKTVEAIGNNVNKLIEFIHSDSDVKDDFQSYLQMIGFHQSSGVSAHQVMMPYLFERRVGEDRKSVIDLYLEKNSPNKGDKEIIEAIKNNIASVYQVKKMFKTGFELFNIVNEKDYPVYSMVKMTNLRGVGIGQYLVARVFALKHEYYMLELSEIISEAQQEKAYRLAVAKQIQDPTLLYRDNPEKTEVLRGQIKDIGAKFNEFFGANKIVTINKKADELLGVFNEYVENGEMPKKEDVEALIDAPDGKRYFEVSAQSADFVDTAAQGFSSENQPYDIGLVYDDSLGLFVVPFLNTFLGIFDEDEPQNIEGYKECIKSFLENDKVPPFVLKEAYSKDNKKFLKLVQESTGEKYTSLKAINEKYKADYLLGDKFSSTTVLYLSNAFNELMGFAQKQQDEAKKPAIVGKVGRNEPCPCGSGKKYKKCCGA